MDPILAGVVFTLIMLILLLAMRMPAGLAMALAGALGIFTIGGFAPLSNVLSFTPYSMASSFTLVTLPMFILMAGFLEIGGVNLAIPKAARDRA